MTLGLLSTGAITGDAANIFSQYSAPGQQNANTATAGMNPQFVGTAEASNVAMATASPFSTLFGPSTSMLNMDTGGNNIDWVSSVTGTPQILCANQAIQDAWDSFLQSSNVNLDGASSNTNAGGGPSMQGFGLWPGGMNMNLDVQNMNGAAGDMSAGDMSSGSGSQTQSPPSQNANFPMAGNVFLGATTPRSGF
jgi:hypothetical protein